MGADSVPVMPETSPLSSPPSRFWALLPCAGTGSRAATVQPKQYQPIAGQPLVHHTLAAFAAVSRLAATWVVVAPGDAFFDVAENATFSIASCGGQTRAQTVLNGLNHLLEQGAVPRDWVLVHDAARCLITPAQITALMVACENDPVGGLLAHRLADTLKQASGDRIAATLERSDKWLAQTPQMFRIGMLRDALAQATDLATDEASAIEALGHAPLLVPGSAQNFKVTYPGDFALAEAVLLNRQKEKRT